MDSRTMSFLYSILYSDGQPEEKLDKIEENLLKHEIGNVELSIFENIIFFFILSGLPFISGLAIGYWVLS